MQSYNKTMDYTSHSATFRFFIPQLFAFLFRNFTKKYHTPTFLTSVRYKNPEGNLCHPQSDFDVVKERILLQARVVPQFLIQYQLYSTTPDI